MKLSHVKCKVGRYQHHIFFCTKTSSFEPNKRHLRELAYGETTLNERNLSKWLHKLTNDEFESVRHEIGSKGDSCQTHELR